MHHVSIRTRDLARAVSFYGALGFSTETSFKNGNQQPAVWLAGPHGRLELVEVVSSDSPIDSQVAPGPIGYDHIVFTVHSLDDVLTTLRAAGSRVLIEPAARTMNGRKYRIAAVRDPDGLLLELGEQGPPA